jgi:hypothetical protein
LAFALERILRPVQRGLTQTASRWPPIEAAYARVFDAIQILNNEERLPVGDLRRRYAHLLSELRDIASDPNTDPGVTSWYATFLKVTASYGETLFRCYEHPELRLPRTNNDLEHLFGSLRYHERRASGRKQVAPTLLLRGQARVLAGVSTRLRAYRAADLPPRDLGRWRALRRELETRQETRRRQRRFRQDPNAYLRALEARCAVAACGVRERSAGAEQMVDPLMDPMVEHSTPGTEPPIS